MLSLALGTTYVRIQMLSYGTFRGAGTFHTRSR
jgi:hypothetical protein